MLPWIECPSLSLDLDRSPEDRIAGVSEDFLERSRQLLAAVQAEISGGQRWLADAVHLRTAYRFLAEMKANAQRVGVDWRDLTLANLSYKLVVGMFACSTIALATAEGPVLARNMDFWPEKWLARASTLMQFTRGGQLAFVNAGWPGAIGVVSGMSVKGFAVVLNAVGGGSDKSGYPVLLHLRRVLEDAESFDAAVDWLASERLMAGALFTVVGTENIQRVVVERKPSAFVLRRPVGDEPLVTTNDYRMLNASEHGSMEVLLQTSCSRFDVLSKLFAKHRVTDEVLDAQLLYALTDPRVRQTITAQHMIFRPREMLSRLFAPRELVREDGCE
ncbi:MAG: C45 family autoproteolytic acyltransferase/hydrolase [Planctomycetia bacterium]|nr:C45 family autoproteolytic acyltransferase/hydrolase [Planctomycetia bacterium]